MKENGTISDTNLKMPMILFLPFVFILGSLIYIQGGESETLKLGVTFSVLIIALLIPKPDIDAYRIPIFALAAVAFAVFSLLGGFLPHWVNPSEEIIGSLILLGLAYFTWLWFNMAWQDRWLIMAIIYLLVASSALIGIFLYVIPLSPLVVIWLQAGRIGGPFEYANTFGAFLASSYWLGYWLSSRKICRTKLYLLFNRLLPVSRMFLIVALFLTKSRGSLIAAAISVLLFVIFSGLESEIVRDVWETTLFGTVLALGALLFGLPGLILAGGVIYVVRTIGIRTARAKFIFPLLWIILSAMFVFLAQRTSLNGRLLSGHTFQDRLAYWRVGLNLLLNRPFGIGFGGWQDLYPSREHFAFYTLQAHNTYLQLIMQTGIEGGLLLVISGAVIVTLIVKKLSQIHRRGNNRTPFLSVLAAWAVLSIHFAADLDGYFLVSWYVFLMFTLVLTEEAKPVGQGQWLVSWTIKIKPLLFTGVLILLVTISGSALASRICLSASDQAISTSQKEELLHAAIDLWPISASARLALANEEAQNWHGIGEASNIAGQIRRLQYLRPFSPDVAEASGKLWLELDRPDRAWLSFTKGIQEAPYRLGLYLLDMEAAHSDSVLNPQRAKVWQRKGEMIVTAMARHAQIQPRWITEREKLPMPDQIPVISRLLESWDESPP